MFADRFEKSRGLAYVFDHPLTGPYFCLAPTSRRVGVLVLRMTIAPRNKKVVRSCYSAYHQIIKIEGVHTCI